jgi:hypothetical protein
MLNSGGLDEGILLQYDTHPAPPARPAAAPICANRQISRTIYSKINVLGAIVVLDVISDGEVDSLPHTGSYPLS